MQIPAMNPLARTIVVLLMAASFSSIPAQAAGPVKVRVPNVDLPFGLDKLPPGLLRNQLKELPANARGNAERWLNSIHFNPQDVPFMRADKDGGIFFVDSYLPTGTLADMPVVEAAAEMLSVEDVFSLHSKQGYPSGF